MRAVCKSDDGALTASAAVNADKGVATVALNTGGAAYDIDISIAGRAVSGTCPAHSTEAEAIRQWVHVSRNYQFCLLRDVVVPDYHLQPLGH